MGRDELLLHREIGEELRKLSIDVLFTLGEKSKEIWKGLGEKKIPGEACTSLSALTEAVKDEVRAGDIVLFIRSPYQRLLISFWKRNKELICTQRSL